MSLPAIVYVFKQTIKPASLKLTLLALAECANSMSLECYPSVKYLCNFTSLDRKTIIDNLTKIKHMGFLIDTGKRTGRTKQIKIYRFNMDLTKSTENGTVSETNRPVLDPKEARNGHLKQARFGHPEPLLEPLKKPKKYNNFEKKLLSAGFLEKELKYLSSPGTEDKDGIMLVEAKSKFCALKLEEQCSYKLDEAFDKWKIVIAA